YLRLTLTPYIGSSGWLRTALEDGSFTLLLDGMDEIPDEIVRRRVASIIRDFVRRYKNCRVALTSRPAGLTPAVLQQLRAGGRLAHCEMRPLDQNQMSRFIQAWYRALVTDPHEAQRRAQGLIKRIEASPRVAELAQIPILLTAVAVVHQTRGDLPERRADLYEHCIRALCG